MAGPARIEAWHVRSVRLIDADSRTGYTHPSARTPCIANHLSVVSNRSSLINAKCFALVAVLLAAIVGAAPDCAEPALLGQTLAAVQDCMARSPAPWPDAWQQEYTDAIHQAATSVQNGTEKDVRLEILSKGFGPYWEQLKKSQDRSLFDVHRAEIRWYVENLMAAELPGQEEKQALRDQFQALCAHATSSLLAQFPFLDPNAVHGAAEDHLSKCYRDIEAPLLPIFLRPFSQAEIDTIKQRWHDLRYARVDLWRQLGGGGATGARQPGSARATTRLSTEHPDYLLTQRSLAQLQPHIWAVVAPAPEYYGKAVADHIAAQKRRLQSRSRAWAEERRLEREHSGQILQTEQIAFMLAALLETTQCLDESACVGDSSDED